MKRINELLQIILALLAVWKDIIVPVLAFFLLVVASLWKFGAKTIHATLPIWTISIVVFFALYTITSLAIKLYKHRKPQFFLYKGILWRRPMFSFLDLTPICPIEGCGRQIKSHKTYNNRLQSVGLSIIELKPEVQYTHECPKHGPLNVPNISINILHKEAKQEIKLGN